MPASTCAGPAFAQRATPWKEAFNRQGQIIAEAKALVLVPHVPLVPACSCPFLFQTPVSPSLKREDFTG